MNLDVSYKWPDGADVKEMRCTWCNAMAACLEVGGEWLCRWCYEQHLGHDPLPWLQ